MALRHKLAIALVLGATPLALSRAEVPTPIGEIGSTESTRPDPKYEEAIRALRRAIFPPGERVENWDVGGADLEAAVRAMGADRYYALDSEADGSVAVNIFTDRPITDFAAPAWRVAKSYGSAAAPLENPSLTFAYMSPRFVLAGRANGRRVRDADCSDTISHAILYEVPGSPGSPSDRDLPDIVTAMMVAVEGQTVCDRYDGDPEKGYALRHFFPDGRELLSPDLSASSSRVTIVPAAPIDTMIKPPTEAPATKP